MKRLAFITFAFVMCLSPAILILVANSSEDTYDPLENPLKDAVAVFEAGTEPLSNVKVATNNTETMAIVAAGYLEEMKVQIGDSCESLGYEPEVFYNMTAGTPFIVYGFDSSGKLQSGKVYASPLIYNGEIVGIINVSYDDVNDSYHYTLGKQYAPQLNHVKDSKNLNTSHGIVIGRVTDKLIATDGTNVEVLFEEPNGQGISVEDIKAIADQLVANASSNYQPIVPVRVIVSS